MPSDHTFRSKIRAGRMAGFHTLVYLLGLALLAWGVDDVTGFFSNSVHAGIAACAITQALMHIWLVFQMPPQIENQALRDPEHWQYGLAELISILVAFGDRRNILVWAENLPLRWVGLAILCLGAAYAFWANLTWVKHVCSNPVLLSTGPYHWTRYPSLLALTLYGLGFVLAFRSWIGLAFFIVLIGIILRCIDQWDKIYAERYRQAWAERCRNSKRIIPFLY